MRNPLSSRLDGNFHASIGFSHWIIPKVWGPCVLNSVQTPTQVGFLTGWLQIKPGKEELTSLALQQ